MKHLAVLGALLLTCCSSIHVNRGETERARELKRDLRSVVAITGPTALVFCSGVFVSQRLVLTAAHCVDGKKTGQLGVFDNYDFRTDSFSREYPYHVKKVDVDADLALLVVRSNPSHTTLRVSFEDPQVGDHVTAIGHPSGLAFSVTEGVVSAPRRQLEGRVFTQSTANAWGGSSGGPVIDSDGALIGITSFAFGGPGDAQAWLVGSVHLSQIRGFLKGIL